ncbi:MAG: hypothetical protein KUG81_08575 [Gammaproteobacteria bacterium]|nr:hypothetical protein [Gammaproteobacteria bacterium]
MPQPQVPEREISAPTLTDSEMRKEFVKLLSKYEQEFEPSIQKSGFSAWNSNLQETLVGMKSEAVFDLGAGKLVPAFAGIEDLLVMASQSVLEFESAFQGELLEAQSAYDSDQYAKANLAISKALSFKPEDKNAMSLNQRITDLPALLNLIGQAEVAKVENNLVEELRLSNAIFDLDPARGSYHTRSIELEGQLREARFEAAIAKGLQAASSANLKVLTDAYGQAKKIFPGRAETKSLEAKLTDLKTQIAVSEFKDTANKAIKEDRWREANEAFLKAATLKPLDTEVVNGLDIAGQILKFQARIDTFLNAPTRLSTASVEKEAQKVVEDADLYSSLSPTLNVKRQSLQNQIVARNRVIDVTVLSDNLTHISVRGVGKVGKILKYGIKLKPGTYFFEGRRKGFKTKTVEVRINPDDQTLQVKVISDEPI